MYPTHHTDIGARNELEKVLSEIVEYKHLDWVDGVGFCALSRMLFTWRVSLDLDAIGPTQAHYCFEDYWSARKFLEEWDGTTEPVVGEHGCTANKRTIFRPKEQSLAAHLRQSLGSRDFDEQ